MKLPINVLLPDGTKTNSVTYDHATKITYDFNSDTYAHYPRYTRGKFEHDIAFKSDGTLCISQKLFDDIWHANGYLRYGKRNVRLSLPHDLVIELERTTFYLGHFVERYIDSINQDIGKTITNVDDFPKMQDIVNKYNLLMESKVLDIRMVSAPLDREYVDVNGVYIGESYYLKELCKTFGCKIGDTQVKLNCKAKDLIEKTCSYTSIDGLRS